MDKELSIIIPAFNEEKEIKRTLLTIADFTKSNNIEYEIIVVDDGSKDQTRARVRRLQQRDKCIRLLKNRRNLGKGSAIKKGVLQAKGKYILFTDVDLSAPIEQYFLFRKFLEKDYDLVFGSRYIRQSRILTPQPLIRQILGKIYYLLVRFFLLKGVSDTNCGFKAYKNKAAKFLFKKQKLTRWGFDAEILFIAQKHKFKIKEFPIKWYDSDYSRVRKIPAVVNTLVELLKIKLNNWQGVYD